MPKDYETGRKVKPVSAWNWMWSIFLAYIPGINLLYFLIASFAAKNTSKRKWAIAHLLWELIVIAILVGLYFLFKDKILTLIQQYVPGFTLPF